MGGSHSALALSAASAWLQRAALRGAALRDRQTHLLKTPHGLTAMNLLNESTVNLPCIYHESTKNTT